MRIKEMLQDHIARMEDAMLEDVIKPLRGIVNVWKQEIENTSKEGSRENVCSRQREAARLGLLANKSLIKAFEIDGANPPMQAIKASQKRWESILNEC